MAEETLTVDAPETKSRRSAIAELKAFKGQLKDVLQLSRRVASGRGPLTKKDGTVMTLEDLAVLHEGTLNRFSDLISQLSTVRRTRKTGGTIPYLCPRFVSQEFLNFLKDPQTNLTPKSYKITVPEVDDAGNVIFEDEEHKIPKVKATNLKNIVQALGVTGKHSYNGKTYSGISNQNVIHRIFQLYLYNNGLIGRVDPADGKTKATFWEANDLLQKHFPSVFDKIKARHAEKGTTFDPKAIGTGHLLTLQSMSFVNTSSDEEKEFLKTDAAFAVVDRDAAIVAPARDFAKEQKK